jgi:serralysin
MTALSALAALTAASAALLPATAAAAQSGARAEIDDIYLSRIFYVATGDQANDLTISQGENDAEFIFDDVVPIKAGQGCTHPDEADATRVACTIPEPDPDPSAQTVNAELGEGDDRAEADGKGWIAVDGESGDDVLTGGEEDQLWGGWGHDTLTGATQQLGEGGRDTLTGSAGDDWLTDGQGADVIRGGGGDDWISDSQGEDELHGGPGNDEIFGGRSDDTLYGDAGNDHLDGHLGNDTLYGGAGDDVLYGGRHGDELDGGPGNDEEHQGDEYP